MSLKQFERWAPLLQAAGVAEAAGEPLDINALAVQLKTSVVDVRSEIEILEGQGQFLSGIDEPTPPILWSVARQFLQRRGDVDMTILNFLPATIDNLDAREALIDGGSVLVDEFRYAVRNGTAVVHARELVPRAFAEAITEAIAFDLYASAIALMVRLSEGSPAGCVGEEIIAVQLLAEARSWLELRRDTGQLTNEQVESAEDALRGLFDLFQDDDVYELFEMSEPADAALAGHTPLYRQLGVVDQRIEAWFTPFDWTTPTGYLHDHDPRPTP